MWAPMTSDMTVLRADRPATKTLIWNPTLSAWRKISYVMGSAFAFTKHPVQGLGISGN